MSVVIDKRPRARGETDTSAEGYWVMKAMHSSLHFPPNTSHRDSRKKYSDERKGFYFNHPKKLLVIK